MAGARHLPPGTRPRRAAVGTSTGDGCGGRTRVPAVAVATVPPGAAAEVAAARSAVGAAVAPEERHALRGGRSSHNQHSDMGPPAPIAFLWSRWDTVVVSTANMSEMCRRESKSKKPRPFGSETARRALCWAHGKFRERLVSSAFARAGKYVVPTGEAYTTQTCGLCGHLNPNVGGATVYRCGWAGCGVAIDRDVNGARNIGLRYLTQQLQGRTAPPQ